MEDLKKLLQRSFDEELSSSEEKQLKAGLANSLALRKQKDTIESLRKSLGDFSPQFDNDFSNRLMKKIQTIDYVSSRSLYSIFKGIAISGAAAIIALLISIYYTDGSLSLDAIYGLYNYAPDEAAVTFFNL